MQEYTMLTEYRAAITQYMQAQPQLTAKYAISTETFKPLYKVLKQDDAPHGVFILQTGLVKVIRTTSLGQAFSLGIFDRGEVLGDVEAIMNMYHFATVETVSRCTFWKILPEQFLSMLANEPEFNLLIHRNVISKLLNTSQMAAIQSTNKLFYSLMVVLREFSKLNELRISKSLLAEALGTSIRNLNRLLAQLEEEKIIRIQQTIIKEIDPQLLQHKIHTYENTIQ